MSFSQDVKNEILHRKIVRSCCVTAAAYAVACFGKYFDDRGVVLQTENEGIAQLAQKLYARCGVTGTVISKERGTGLIYEFSVKDPEQVQKMLNLFGHTGRETTLRIRPDCFKCQKCGSFSFPLHFYAAVRQPTRKRNITLSSFRPGIRFRSSWRAFWPSMSSIPTAPCARGPTPYMSNPATIWKIC